MKYNSKWLHITAFNSSNMEKDTKSYLFNINPEQEVVFMIFLKEIDKHNGYWPCGKQKEHTDTLDCKDLYPAIFENENVLEYLDSIADYFPNLITGFDFLTIDFDKTLYGYKNNKNMDD